MTEKNTDFQFSQWSPREPYLAATAVANIQCSHACALQGSRGDLGYVDGVLRGDGEGSYCSFVMAKSLLTFVDDVYEDLELWYPRLRLQEAGYGTRVAGLELKSYTGKHGYPAKSDLLLEEARSADFCGLLIPGGFMPDKLRREQKVLDLTREFYEQRKLVAFICHGGWIPISAGIVRGKRVTGSRGIKDDLENAGAIWVDQAVVIDGNLISSRTPRDLAPFGKAMVEFLEAHSG